MHHPDDTTTYEWFVADPINNYDVAVNAGTYAHWTDTLQGEAGPLTLDFWPLAYHLDTAKVQFQQAKTMLACFEHWFGPYPWYTRRLQAGGDAATSGWSTRAASRTATTTRTATSAATSRTPAWGSGWDFIIVHESAHEWWGNNLTDQDVADMWIHESFANYAENLYEECLAGKAKGAEYVIGTRKNIRNDEPIVGIYRRQPRRLGGCVLQGRQHAAHHPPGDRRRREVARHPPRPAAYLLAPGGDGRPGAAVHQRARGDRPRAGCSCSICDDHRSRYSSTRSSGDTLSYHWADVVPGFAMPVRVTLADSTYAWIHPTEAWQSVPVHLGTSAFKVDENFYVLARDLDAPPPAAKDSAAGKP